MPSFLLRKSGTVLDRSLRKKIHQIIKVSSHKATSERVLKTIQRCIASQVRLLVTDIEFKVVWISDVILR